MRTLAGGGATSVATTILPRTSTVVSAPSPTNIVVPETSAAAFDVGVMSVQSSSALPWNVTELDTVETRVRRMFHHWKYVPSSPRGASPILRISSATQIDARISSSVPASRPRMSSPAMAYMSRLMSASRIADIAAGGRTFDDLAAWAPATEETSSARVQPRACRMSKSESGDVGSRRCSCAAPSMP